MNHVVLFGNLGFDPELKITSNGNACLKLRMATTERFKDAQGNWKEHTEWHRVVLWGRRAESLSQHISKGSKLLVTGRLATTSYDDNQGTKRYTTEVIATDIELGGNGRRGEPQAGPDEPREPPPGTSGRFDGDDIPF